MSDGCPYSNLQEAVTGLAQGYTLAATPILLNDGFTANNYNVEPDPDRKIIFEPLDPQHFGFLDPDSQKNADTRYKVQNNVLFSEWFISSFCLKIIEKENK